MEEDAQRNEVEMMRVKGHIEGFWDRIEVAVARSGMSKREITDRMCVNRKLLYGTDRENISSLYVAKFCAVTGTDANWLLGLKGGGS